MTYGRRAVLRASAGAGLLLLGGRSWAQPPRGPAADLAASGFRGQIIAPASPGYAEARRMFVANPRRPASPQLIAICADEDDVRRAIAFARRQSLQLAVRAGGHDLAAASICDGLVLDLSALQSIRIDGRARTVKLGAGVRAGALNAALAERGLAAALGCSGRVGVSGLTLSGGLGWLVGRHGAACDHLLAARVVTAEGQVLRTSADENPDLLWALRGGGGNFGVVTELTLRVHPAPQVTTGMVALRGDDVPGFLRPYRDYLASAGDAIDLEMFAFAPRGEPLIFIKACWSGDSAGAERALAPLRRLGHHLADDLAPRPYTGLIDPTAAVAPLLAAPAASRQPDDVPGLHVGAVSLAPMDDPAIEIIGERIRRAEGGWLFGLGHYLHGAAARPAPDHSAMLRVAGQITPYVIANWRRREDAGRRMAWVDDTVAALRPRAGPTYVNYLTTDDHGDIRRAYGAHYGRLAAIKRRYDPGNVFRRNRNITPA